MGTGGRGGQREGLGREGQADQHPEPAAFLPVRHVQDQQLQIRPDKEVDHPTVLDVEDVNTYLQPVPVFVLCQFCKLLYPNCVQGGKLKPLFYAKKKKKKKKKPFFIKKKKKKKKKK